MKKTFLGALLFALALVGCGGGGSSGGSSTTTASPTSQNNGTQTGQQSLASNQVPVVVDGAGTFEAWNRPMVSVTLCQPGTTNCTTIPNIIVDSGSSGLVLAASAIPSSLNLQTETLSDNNSIGGCSVYGGGVAWGPMVTADVQMAGEVAHSVPVELVGSSSFATIPSDCSSQGTTLYQNASDMGTNGILGIAGDYGYTSTVYYGCTSSTCGNTPVSPAATQQLTGVIGKFAQDNNGAILSFPAVAEPGSPSVMGTLTFGLNTQANNSTASVSMVPGLSNASMSATYNGQSMSAILDSGSVDDYLGSSSISTCAIDGLTWLCPASDTTQSVTYQYAGGGSPLNVTFTVGNAQSLFAKLGSPNWAIPNLAEQADLFGDPYLDLGMSFLFGHALYLGYPPNGATSPTIGLTTISSNN